MWSAQRKVIAFPTDGVSCWQNVRPLVGRHHPLTSVRYHRTFRFSNRGFRAEWLRVYWREPPTTLSRMSMMRKSRTVRDDGFTRYVAAVCSVLLEQNILLISPKAYVMYRYVYDSRNTKFIRFVERLAELSRFLNRLNSKTPCIYSFFIQLSLAVSSE